MKDVTKMNCVTGMKCVTGMMVAAAICGTTAWATIPEGDVQPYLENGILKTGLISEDGLTSTPNVRVFFAELGEDVPNFTAEPGWLALDGTFNPNVMFTFQINRALRQWNGTDFSTLGGSMQLTFGPLTPAVTPATDAIIQGFSLPIDSEGGLHDHPFYELLNPAADGVYLLDLSFSVPGQGLNTTEPIWILFGQNADEATSQAAYEYATANVPGPGVIAALGLGVVGTMLRRRGKSRS